MSKDKETAFDFEAFAAGLEAMPIEKLKITQRTRGVDFNTLDNDVKAQIDRNIMVNFKLADAFNKGKFDEVAFLEIDENPTKRYGKMFKRGEMIKFNEGGEVVEDEIVEFVRTGSSAKAIEYQNAEGKTVSFKKASVSIRTKGHGLKSVNRVL